MSFWSEIDPIRCHFEGGAWIHLTAQHGQLTLDVFASDFVGSVSYFKRVTCIWGHRKWSLASNFTANLGSSIVTIEGFVFSGSRGLLKLHWTNNYQTIKIASNLWYVLMMIPQKFDLREAYYSEVLFACNQALNRVYYWGQNVYIYSTPTYLHLSKVLRFEINVLVGSTSNHPWSFYV